MDEKKRNNVKVQIVFSTLIFIVAFFMELYAMINDSQMYILICGIAVIALLALYFLVNGIMNMAMLNDLKKEEQYDNLYRSEKASYLMIKKRFEELEQEMKSVERSAMIPVDEIISAQKGIAKVIISRNEESFESIKDSNNTLSDQINRLSNQMNEANKLFLEEEKTFSSENFQQMLDKQQEILLNLKDMELRLSTSIMQSQKMIAEQKALLHQPQVIQQPFLSPVPVQQPVMTSAQEISSNAAVNPEKEISEPILEETALEIPEPVLEDSEPEIPEPVLEDSELEIPEPEIEDSELEIPELIFADEESAPEDEEPVLVAEEPVLEEAEPVLIDEEPVVEEAEPVLIDEEPMLESVHEEKPPMPDLSDPNRPMSPEDIAALLANMTQDVENAEPAEKHDEKISTEEAVEESPENQPVIEILDADESEEAPLMEILDDIVPEQLLNEVNDQVAVDTNEEENKGSMPDLSDPNKKLSADEIAALFANMQ